MHIVSYYQHITLLSMIGYTICYVTSAITVASVHIPVPCRIKANDTIPFVKTTNTAGLFRFLR